MIASTADPPFLSKFSPIFPHRTSSAAIAAVLKHFELTLSTHFELPLEFSESSPVNPRANPSVSPTMMRPLIRKFYLVMNLILIFEK